MNNLERWNKAALQVMHEAKDLNMPTMDMERIQERIAKWEADQTMACVVATEFYRWMQDEETHFSPDATIESVFDIFWHDQLGKP